MPLQSSHCRAKPGLLPSTRSLARALGNRSDMATTRDPINAQRGRGGFKAPHHGRRGQQAADDLLHFTLPPRQPPPAPRRESNKKRESPNDQRQRYIHAQYREPALLLLSSSRAHWRIGFMLRPDRDYTANFCDGLPCRSTCSGLPRSPPRQRIFTSNGRTSCKSSCRRVRFSRMTPTRSLKKV